MSFQFGHLTPRQRKLRGLQRNGFTEAYRIRVRQFGGRFKGVSRKRLMVIATASVAGIIILVGLLLPYLTMPKYYATTVTMEERTVLFIPFNVGEGEVGDFLPERMKPEAIIAQSSYVFMHVGLGRLSTGGKSYDYVFARFHVHMGARVGVGPASGGGPIPYNYYILDFFSNSTELGELFRGYGLPHTYVNVLYQCVSGDPMTRTSLAVTYPDGQPLLELLAVTNETGEKGSGVPFYHMGGFAAGDKINLYHLGNSNNLTFLHITQRTASYIYHPSSHANITFAENTPPWRYVAKTAITIRNPVVTITEYLVTQGKLGWVIWK